MAKTLIEKIGSVIDRRNPEGFELAESYAFDEADDVSKYIRLAMAPVGDVMTNRSKDAGARVKDHLSRALQNVSFQYQGSIMTDTHIEGASDIDLLVLPEQFFGWDRVGIERSVIYPENARYSQAQMKLLIDALKTQPYKGDPLEDLGELRVLCEESLAKVYDEHDFSKGKSMKIRNQHLNREVDVVIASWFDDASSFANGRNLCRRGIQLYNREIHQRDPVDHPFLRAKLINERSSETDGRLKKMIRLLKTVKAESDKDVDFSSFDIYAVCYAMPTADYANLPDAELVPAVTRYLYAIAQNSILMKSLRSVDGGEYIFNTPDKKDGFEILVNELFELSVMMREGGLI